MRSPIHDVFADSAYWIALVVKQDQFHARARDWSLRISGRITTTSAVLLETANMLSRPLWRTAAMALINHVLQHEFITIVELSDSYWQRSWQLYCNRTDKSWSLTDCFSFIVMEEYKLTVALTSDEHFRQAGYIPLLLEAE